MQNLGTYLNFPPPHCLFTMTLLLGSDEDLGVFTRETSNVKREIERKFCPDQNSANFGGFGRLWVTKSFDFHCKRHICA